MKNTEYFTGHELRVEISRFLLDSYETGGSGCTIFCSIWNQSKKRAEVKLISSFIINSESEQIDRDYYLIGYQFTEKSIEAGAMCTCGEIFLENRAGKIDAGWCYCIEIQDETNGKTYKVLFKLDNMQTKEWEIISCDIISSPVIVTPKMLSKKLKKSVERIEAFEEKLGIKIENVTIVVSDSFDYISVFCDIYALNGNNLNSSITLATTFYDEENNILGTPETYIDNDDFMGFESCEISSIIDANEVKKIRLYPKKG
ncbi:hypothetical protein [Methanosarcina sp.]|uniref:hypothetical protein n=1 Tax=Methanosarcina sp. TaxID=2213 RepID=UPI002ABC9095|nr:hypothetical protein [Methanosarcina sp.]MDY9924897.1 hypothetical protein [Methanosarcina sp.]